VDALNNTATGRKEPWGTMTEFQETALRHMCRNPKCRMRLPTPVANVAKRDEGKTTKNARGYARRQQRRRAREHRARHRLARHVARAPARRPGSRARTVIEKHKKRRPH
jgi:hypothetical protein